MQRIIRLSLFLIALSLTLVSKTQLADAAIRDAVADFDEFGDIRKFRTNLQLSFAEYTNCVANLGEGCFKAVLDPEALETFENALIVVPTERFGPITRISYFNGYGPSAPVSTRPTTPEDIEGLTQFSEIPTSELTTIELPITTIFPDARVFEGEGLKIVEVEFVDPASVNFGEFVDSRFNGAIPIGFNAQEVTAMIDGELVSSTEITPANVLVFGTVFLEPESVVPGPVALLDNAEDPSGNAFVSLNLDSNQLNVTGTVSDLTSDITKIGIYGPASSSETGPAILEFTDPMLFDGLNSGATNIFNLSDFSEAMGGGAALMLSEEEAGWIEDFRAYIQVSTAMNPDGEIRGTIGVPEPQSSLLAFIACLCGLLCRSRAKVIQ